MYIKTTMTIMDARNLDTFFDIKQEFLKNKINTLEHVISIIRDILIQVFFTFETNTDTSGFSTNRYPTQTKGRKLLQKCFQMIIFGCSLSEMISVSALLTIFLNKSI